MRALVAVVVVLIAVPSAHAEDDVFGYGAAHLGLGLPMGAVGAELGVGLDWLRASGSIGRGFQGVNMGAMVRAVGEVKSMDVGIGLGVSRGPGLHDIAAGHEPEDGPITQFGENTRWLDLEVIFELAVSDHGFVRFTAGVTHAFDIDCASEEPDSHGICTFDQKLELDRASYAPYFGIAGGLRFPEAPSSKARHAIPYTNPPPSFIAPY